MNDATLPTTASALAFAGLSGFAWLRRRKQA